MLDLPDDWVWDFWTAADGPDTHLFFLHAPRSLGDPDLRHRAARVGHAVSRDLVTWRRLPDPLPDPPPGAHDDLATWTGSVVRGPDRWWMFTSGLSHVDDGNAQRVGAATSTDLLTWERQPLRLEADARSYLREPDGAREEHWRDPLVVAGVDGRSHMYLTAKVPGGDPADPDGARGNGVVGHAVSDDLVTWTVQPPLSPPTGRFDQLEVLRLAEVDGRWFCVFSCLGAQTTDGPGRGGTWSVPVEGPGLPLDPTDAVRLTGEELYVADVLATPAGPVLLAFRHGVPGEAFRGGVVDPVPVRVRADGRGLEVVPAAVRDR